LRRAEPDVARGYEFAVGVGTAAGWALIVPGVVALLVSLTGAWLIQKSRDRTLR